MTSTPAPSRQDLIAACPFCGSNDAEVLTSSFGMFRGKCPGCGAEGPVKNSRFAATEAWNTRAALASEPDPQPVAERWPTANIKSYLENLVKRSPIVGPIIAVPASTRKDIWPLWMVVEASRPGVNVSHKVLASIGMLEVCEGRIFFTEVEARTMASLANEALATPVIRHEPIDGWLPVAGLKDTMAVGDQLDVIFCSPSWSWPIVGMVTRWEDRLEWSIYDQINDKFQDWNAEEPTLFMLKPTVPSQKGQ